MFRWGFVGSVGISVKVANELSHSKDQKVLGVYSKHFEHAESFANRFKCKAYKSFLDMVNDPEIDGIYIATPHGFHYYYSKIALENHKPVLCEKTLTLNYETAKELFDLAEKNNTYFAEAMWTWFNPTARKVREWVQEGKIGKCTVFNGDFSLASILIYRKKRLYDLSLGGGCLFDLGVYPVTYAYCLFGYPDSIEAKAKMIKGIDYKVKVIFNYNDGRKCKVTCSFLNVGNNSAIVKGEHGTIKAGPVIHETRKAVLKNGKVEKFVDDENINLYERELLLASQEIMDKKIESAFVPKQQTLDVMKILEEIKSQIGLNYPKDR